MLTLASSLDDDARENITTHDLLDAYTTLALRIRALCTALTGNESTIPALQALKTHSRFLSRRIQRDIRHALEDPFGSSTSQSTNEPFFNAMIQPAIQAHGDLICAVQDSSALCQQAIQVVSLIFKFPALYSFFTDTVLSHLLHDLLTIARSSDLPSFDGEKTCALAAWTFATIQLPATILLPHQDAILAWMSELTVHMSPRNKGSKILHHLWSQYPAACLPNTADTLPEIFSRLVSSDVATRAEGAVALSGFAYGLLSVWSSTRNSFKAAALRELRKFLFSEGGDGDPPGARLPQIIARAVREDTAGAPHVGPRWAVTVICCLIILSGHGVLASHRLCGFVIKTAELVTNCKKKPGTELLICIWRSLIWAFSHYPKDDIPSKTASKEQLEHPGENPRNLSFDIVRQEPRGGNAVCLIASLLYERPCRSAKPSPPELDKAITVLKGLVSSPSDSVYQDGVSILEKLVGTTGTSEGIPADVSTATWTPGDIPIKAMFSRRLLDAELPAFSSAIHDACCVSLSAIRPLVEQEIQLHWKELLEVWTACARRELRRAKLTTLPDVLVQVWQALLLVKTHLTQGFGHLTASPESTDCVVLVLADFLDCSASPETTSSPIPADAAQCRALSVCHQLWGVARNVFSESWLSTAAGSLLGSVVRRTFNLSSEVKMAWSNLCASLISTNAPDFVARLVVEDEDHRKLDIRRKLWSLTAQTWTAREPPPNWTDSVDLLVLPLRHWALDEDADVTFWGAILQHAISQAQSLSEPSSVVFEAIAERIEDPAQLVDTPKIFLHMLSQFNVDDDAYRKSAFLQYVGTLLHGLYTETAENISTVVQALGHIRRVVQNCPLNAVLPVLSFLSDGLSAWIGDENEVLLIQDHNDVVVPLYCDALNALRKIPMSADTLQAFAPFFCSAFVRIPEPGRGPIAFCEFWAHIQPSLAHLNGAYPEEIKAALRASHDVLGIDVVADISLETRIDERPSALTSPAQSPPPKRSMQRSECDQDSLSKPRQPTLFPFQGRRTSPAVSTNMSPFLSTPGAKRPLSHAHAEDDSPPTPLRRRMDVHRSPNSMPSSPTEALRMRRLAAGPSSRVAHERVRATPDRPVKHRKFSPLLASPKCPTSGPSKRNSSPSTSSVTSRKWRFDGVEVETFKGFKRHTSTAGSSIPQPVETTATQMLIPEVPSPTVAAMSRAPPSDDYDAWEVPICADDDMDIVADSQPSDDKDDNDDPLLPSFMKEPQGRRGQYRDDPDNPDGTPNPSSKALGKRPQRTARTQTAPPSFLGEDSPDAEPEHTAPAPLQRAQTAFAQLEGLQAICDALEKDGSQLDWDQMVAMAALNHRLGAVVSEKMSNKLPSLFNAGRKSDARGRGG